MIFEEVKNKQVEPPQQYVGTKREWGRYEVKRSVHNGKWRINENYHCVRCLSPAYEHPYTSKIWGCKKCDFTTFALAVHFARMEDAKTAQDDIIQRAEMLIAQPRPDFFKYVICAHARSGTHLLATLLNSHPEVACEGEVRPEGRDPEKGYSSVSWDAIASSTNGVLPPPGDVRGCLVPYIGIDTFLQHGYRPDKWIHLLRDPRDTALSLLRRWYQRAGENNEIIKPHYTKADRDKIPESYRMEIEEPILANMTKRVAGNMERVTAFLKQQNEKGRISLITVRYEDITPTRTEVTTADNEATRLIQVFIGVKPQPLTTPLAKTSLK